MACFRYPPRILEAEVAKPYAESYGWPRLAYATNLQGRDAQAIARRERAMLALDPRLDFLRDNPRFRELSKPEEPKVGR